MPDAAIPTTKSPARTPCALEILDRALEPVFRAFLRSRERLVAAGDDALHHLGIGAVGGRALGRIEHAEASRRSGANVKETAARAERLLRLLDRARDRLALRCDGVGDGVVFSVDQIHDLERRREVDLGRARIAALGEAGIDKRCHPDASDSERRPALMRSGGICVCVTLFVPDAVRTA